MVRLAPLPAAAPQRIAARADVALLRPVRHGNAFEETIERVLQLIKLGVVGPGERLPPERDLSARLGVSRATLRAVSRALREAGYVESRRGRYGGTFVRRLPTSPPPQTGAGQGTAAPATLKALQDVLTFRHVLETGAAEQAAARTLTPTEIGHLRTTLALAADADHDGYRRCDSRLHLAVAELSGATSVTAAVADARTALNELLDAIPLLADNIRHSDRQHHRIVSAIVNGRPDEARAAMDEHLRGTASLLRAFLV